MPKPSKYEPHGFTTCDSETIRRLINNQKQEHANHAFRAGHDGMNSFNQLMPVLRSLAPDELEQWMDLIDKMGETHRSCLPCRCKVLAYSFLITKDILPERSAEYKRLYDQCITNNLPPEGRNYLAEVIHSLSQYSDTPAELAHKNFWKSTLAIFYNNQLQGG